MNNGQTVTNQVLVRLRETELVWNGQGPILVNRFDIANAVAGLLQVSANEDIREGILALARVLGVEEIEVTR